MGLFLGIRFIYSRIWLSLMGFENLVARRYAQALFLVAKDSKKPHATYKELSDFFNKIDNNQGIEKLLLNQLVPKKMKSVFCSTMLEQLQLSSVTKNFIYLLIRNRRLFLLKKIVLSFKDLLNKHDNIKVVEVMLARKIDEKSTENIKSQLANYFKTKNLEFDFKLNKKILGGIVIKTGSVMIDFSILSKLYKMQPTIDISTLKTTGTL